MFTKEIKDMFDHFIENGKPFVVVSNYIIVHIKIINIVNNVIFQIKKSIICSRIFYYTVFIYNFIILFIILQGIFKYCDKLVK